MPIGYMFTYTLYTQVPSKSTIHVGKYTSPMDDMGWYQRNVLIACSGFNVGVDSIFFRSWLDFRVVDSAND